MGVSSFDNLLSTSHTVSPIAKQNLWLQNVTIEYYGVLTKAPVTGKICVSRKLRGDCQPCCRQIPLTKAIDRSTEPQDQEIDQVVTSQPD
jgi:hypothetical protein